VTVARLAELCWTDLTGDGPPILAIPLGATEQHGPHLPLGTDTLVAEALAGRLAAHRTDVVVAPPLPYGSSGEHSGFPGTISMGAEALEHVVVELVRSADAFSGAVLVSGHGGNADPLARAVARLRREGRRAVAWWPQARCLPADADAHAGRTETSLVLALAPEQVRTAAARPGERRPLPEILPTLRREGVASVAPNGVLGDPSGATAAEGEAILAGLAADLMGRVADEFGGQR